MVWPTFPGLDGLSLRRDLNVGITPYDPPSGVVMATYKHSMYVKEGIKNSLVVKLQAV